MDELGGRRKPRPHDNESQTGSLMHIYAIPVLTVYHITSNHKIKWINTILKSALINLMKAGINIIRYNWH